MKLLVSLVVWAITAFLVYATFREAIIDTFHLSSGVLP